MMCFPEKLTIAWLQNAYDAGDITPGQVAEEVVRRAAQYCDYHIWITPPDFAKIKLYIDRLPQNPSPEYPLWGIPFAVKDNIDLEGVPTTAGCPDYEYTPKESATVVQKLIDARRDSDRQNQYGPVRDRFGRHAQPLRGVPKRAQPGADQRRLQFRLGGFRRTGYDCVLTGDGYGGLRKGARSTQRAAGLQAAACGAWSAKGVVPACASLDCVTVFANCLEDRRACQRGRQRL